MDTIVPRIKILDEDPEVQAELTRVKKAILDGNLDDPCVKKYLEIARIMLAEEPPEEGDLNGND